jgi:hypothetical protein
MAAGTAMRLALEQLDGACAVALDDALAAFATRHGSAALG